MKKENDIETVARDPAKCHNAFAAWAVIYNTASSVPGALLVHYFKDRCWCLGLHSGFFFGMGGSATVAYKFYLSINKTAKRKNIKKTKYILTDIHKHLHEGQNNGKEVTVLEDMRDHTEQLRKEWNYEQYIG